MFEVLDGNYKGSLLEIATSYFGVEHPEYVHSEYGPHHAKVFLCICIFKKQASSSKGRTKVEAEQFASREMLNKIQECFFERKEDEWIFSTLKEHTVLSQETLNTLGDLKNDSCFDVLGLYGDAVLRYFIADYLFKEYSNFREGIYTRIVSEALKQETRAIIAKNLLLEKFVKHESTERTLAEILSVAIGKLSLASGLYAEDLMMKHYGSFIDLAIGRVLSAQVLSGGPQPFLSIKTDIHNFKGELQEYVQGKRSMPVYKTISKEGAEHDPVFTVTCTLGRFTEYGYGKTVKSAEQDAAREVLTKIRQHDAASTRIVGSSNSYSKGGSDFKVFEDTEFSDLKKNIGWSRLEVSEYLETAFTHPSINSNVNYQRLEFLGDAILRKILLAHLLKTHPEIRDKVVLSLVINNLVSAETQAKIANRLNLGTYLYTQTPPSDNMLSDVLEAFIAAIWLDATTESDHKKIENIVINWFQKSIHLAISKFTKPRQASSKAKTGFTIEFMVKPAHSTAKQKEKQSDTDITSSKEFSVLGRRK